ncbi:MAG: class I SAM-dependent methyltransferase [Acidimicrobiales bacterium]
MSDRWNHNIHYGRQLVDMLPSDAVNALDIGCGEGWLVRELHEGIPGVVGIPTRPPSKRRDISDIIGDFLTYPLTPGSFDVIVAAHRLTKSSWETPAPKIWPPPPLLPRSTTNLRGRPSRTVIPPTHDAPVRRHLDETGQ